MYESLWDASWKPEFFSDLNIGSSGKKNCLLIQEKEEMQVWSLGWKDLLGEGMTVCFSILAWRIPWIGEAGGPLSTGLQRVGHD